MHVHALAIIIATTKSTMQHLLLNDYNTIIRIYGREHVVVLTIFYTLVALSAGVSTYGYFVLSYRLRERTHASLTRRRCPNLKTGTSPTYCNLDNLSFTLQKPAKYTYLQVASDAKPN